LVNIRYQGMFFYKDKVAWFLLRFYDFPMNRIKGFALAAVLLCTHCSGTTAPAPAASCSTHGASNAPGPHSAPQQNTKEAWELLVSRLPGKWQANVAGGNITVAYRLVSNNSVLLETFRTHSGKETISVIHHDGPHLQLTHYCGQQNQPRLRAHQVSKNRVRFEFLDVSDLDSDESVMRSLEFAFHAQGFDQISIYRDGKGHEETETIHFFRQPSELSFPHTASKLPTKQL
jgi:hypothetical protein